MNTEQRRPPNLRIPEGARWFAVIALNNELEVWWVDLRRAGPGFAPIFCDVPNQKVIHTVVWTNALSSFGSRFFWSETGRALAVQKLTTFEYSERSEISYVVYRGPAFDPSDETPILFPPEWIEVFPTMYADQSR